MQYDVFTEQIISKITEIAPHYTQWKFDRERPDAGSALAIIFAQQTGKSLEKFHKMPLKHKIALYRLLGADILPAIGSSGFLELTCPSGVRGQQIKKGFKFYSPSTEKGRLVFETQEDIFITPAKLTEMIFTDYVQDGIKFWEGAFPFKTADSANERYFEFTHEYLRLGQPVYFRIDGSKGISEALSNKRSAEAYYINGQGEKKPVECVMTEKGLYFNGLPECPNEVVGVGFKILSIDDFEDLSLTAISIAMDGSCAFPDAIIVKGEEISDTEFNVFGNDYAVYDSTDFFCDTALNIANSEIKLCFDVDFDVINEGETTPYVLSGKFLMLKKKIPNPKIYDITLKSVEWEYYNGLGFAPLKLKTPARTIFSNSQSGRYTLEFVRPEDMRTVLIGSREGYCIRARVSGIENAWKRPARIFVPRVSNVCFSYTAPLASVLACEYYTDGQSTRLDSFSKICFSRTSPKNPVLYLGFDKPVTGGTVRLFLECAGGGNGNWQCFTKDGWKDAYIEDGTETLKKIGSISLNNSIMDACEIYGRKAYWLRIVFNEPVAPIIQSIYLNALNVRQCETVLNERYFSDKTGIVKLKYENILDEAVFVGEEFDQKLIPLKDYTLDRAEGVIEFANELKQNEGFSFKINCRFGGGEHTNMPAGTEFIPALTLECVSQAKNPLPFSGGRERESISQASERIGKTLRNHARAVTVQDYRDLIDQNDVEEIECISRNGKIVLVVLIKEYKNPFAFLNFRNRAQKILNASRPASTAEIEIIPPEFVPMDIKAELLVNSDGNAREIENALLEICDPITRMKAFGTGNLPNVEEIRSALTALVGVSACQTVHILNDAVEKPFALPIAGNLEIMLLN